MGACMPEQITKEEALSFILLYVHQLDSNELQDIVNLINDNYSTDYPYGVEIYD